MNANDIKTRSIQTDLMRNASGMLQAVACLDDEALQEISEIVFQIERLADKMERRIGECAHADTLRPRCGSRPTLTIV